MTGDGRKNAVLENEQPLIQGPAMWILLWLMHCPCLGLTWLLGAISLGSFLLMFGLNLKGRTVGVTRAQQVLGLYCLFSFLGGLLAALGIWCIAAFIEVRRDAAISRELVDLQAMCSALGDSQPVPKPPRAMLFKGDSGTQGGTSLAYRTLSEGVAGRTSPANRLLPGPLRGGWGETLVFSVLGPPHPAGERVPQEVVDVQVIRWPQRTANGRPDWPLQPGHWQCSQSSRSI